MSRTRTVSIALGYGGLRAGLAHVSARILGDPRFLRPASSIDFRHFGLNPANSLNSFIELMIPSKSAVEIQEALSKSKEGIDAFLEDRTSKLSFPERWNSGRNLQYLLSSMVLLVKPDVVVETGSANGASAAAICFALDQNQTGKLWSYDIEPDVGQLVPMHLRSRVTFVTVSGNESDFRAELEKLNLQNGPSIFLHDSDHSYKGQNSDYRLADELGFSFILSDDVDSSLAFCDFAGTSGNIFFDAPKFIGAIKKSTK